MGDRYRLECAMTTLTQWQTDWATEELVAESPEVTARELLDEIRDAPDSELYQLALTLLREAAEEH
jgi:hypothetical protein